MLILLFVFAVFVLVYFFRKERTRRNKLVLVVLLCLFIAITFEGFFVRPYPQKTNFHKENSIELVSLNTWYNIRGIGLVYMKDLSVIDNEYLRLCFRRPGLTSDGIQGVGLFDTSGKGYKSTSHGMHMGLILSAGVAEYRIEDGYGDSFYLLFNERRIDLRE
jgi:energy-coupling factor transporter transmembrane protein EcfT